jgi:hypothetical protein
VPTKRFASASGSGFVAAGSGFRWQLKITSDGAAPLSVALKWPFGPW